MKEIKFSIHVPVYNSELTLHKCVQSVLAQRYTNFELILIDDGSTDTSGQICDEYQNLDCRIKVIHQHNQGVLLARINSLKYATGDYILFVDSDDWVSCEMLSSLKDRIDMFGPDMLIYDMYSVNSRNTLKKNNLSLCHDEIIIGDHIKGLRNSFANGEIYAIWRKAVKRDIVILCDVCSRFGRLQMGEDAIISCELLNHTRSIVYINEPLYYYWTDNKNSLTKKNDVTTIEDLLIVQDTLCKTYKGWGLYSDSIFRQSAINGLLAMYNSILLRIACCSQKRKEKKLLYSKIRESKTFSEIISIIYDCNISIYKKIPIFLVKNKLYDLITLMFILRYKIGEFNNL